MLRSFDPYRLFLAGVVIIGIAGIGFAGFLTFQLVVGPNGVSPASEELDTVACEQSELQELDPPADAFAVETTTLDFTDEHFSKTDLTQGETTTVTLSFDRERVFDAHAVRVDGSSPTVTVDGTTVTVEDEQGDRIKLWVDAETADGDRVRHTMELCP